MKKTETFWKALNSPLIVVVVALLLLAVLSVLTFKYSVSIMAKETIGAVRGAFNAFGQDDHDEDREFLKIRDGIVFTNVQKGYSGWPSREKFIGTVTNNSDKILKQIMVIASFYNANNELIDVSTQWLSDMTVLPPKESFNFIIQRDIGNHQDNEEVLNLRSAARVDIKIGSVEMFEEEKANSE